MIEVVVPPDRFTTMRSEGCNRWLVKHSWGAAIGRMEGGQFLISFDEASDAEAFSAVWIEGKTDGT